MQIPSIETPQLVLRAWTGADAEALHAILQEEGILRYFPNPQPPPRSGADDYIARQLSHWEQYGYGHWAVVGRDGGRVLGWCGLEYLPELGQSEVAYLLTRGVWGLGYASQAAQAAVRYGFENAGLPLIIGLVHPDNAASIRVLEKCGMALADRITLWGLDLLRYRVAAARAA